METDDARPGSDIEAPAGTGPGRPPDRDQRAKLEVSGTQVCASALASVSAAVIGSFFGVADTLIGAAVASVVATLGSAVYGLWLRRGSERLKDVEVTRITALTRVVPAASSDRRPAGGKDGGDDAAPDPGGDGRHRPGWWVWLSQRRRGALAGIAIVFVATVGIITAVELVAQRPLAGVSDGDSSGITSIGQVFRGSDSGSEGDEPTTSTPTTGLDDTVPDATGTPGEGGAPSSTTSTTSEASEPSGADGNDSESPAPTSEATTTTSGASTTSTATTAPPAGAAGSGSPSPAAE